MPGIVAIAIGVMVSGILTGPVQSTAQTRPAARLGQSGASVAETRPALLEHDAVARLSEGSRKAAFAQMSACRAGVRKHAQDLYPEMKLQSPGYSVKADVKRFRERARFEDAGVAACARETMEKHAIDRAELQSIVSEGACRQWPPLTGKPACE